jgi:putative oxidoreductase
MKAAFLIGRLLFGGFFFYNGLNHFIQHKTMTQYAGAKKLPQPHIAVSLSGIALLAGGASILLGIKPKLGALAIIAFLASVSPTMHDFWHAQDPNQRMNDMINFSKNMALLGGALALMALREPWPVSVPIAQPSTPARVRRLASSLAA